MIQRIQTVYLILAVLFTIAVIFTGLFDQLIDDPAAWIFSGFVAAAAFSIGLSLWSIFKFADRKAQSAMVGKAMIFQIITIGVGVAVFFTIGSLNPAHISEFVGIFFLFMGLSLQFLARLAIDKDEKLVNSIDRLR